MRVLLLAVLTDLGAKLTERNHSIAKEESLVMGYFSGSRTIKLRKEVGSSISLSLSVCEYVWMGSLR